KLGLDLQGGMNVTIEVSKPDVLKALAGENEDDPNFVKALESANSEYLKNGGDFIDVFALEYAKVAPKSKLSSVFSTAESQIITFSSSNEEVISYLKSELDGKSKNTTQVIEARLNQGNVSQPNIQEVDGGRISV